MFWSEFKNKSFTETDLAEIITSCWFSQIHVEFIKLYKLGLSHKTPPTFLQNEQESNYFVATKKFPPKKYLDI